MDNKNQEDLQSRREFFKSAAKATLPVLGAIVLANLPLVQSQAATGCSIGCKDGCYFECSGSCTNYCKDTCAETCDRSCKWGCRTQAYA